MRRAVCALWLVLSCKQTSTSPGPALPDPPDGQAQSPFIFPDRAPPFAAASPVENGTGFIRRSYVWKDKRVEVTVASAGPEPRAYDQWLAGSKDYPQVALPLPADEANGFFTCTSSRDDAACDLHIQLRVGVHIEAMGNGRVERQDLNRLIAHMPLSALINAPR